MPDDFGRRLDAEVCRLLFGVNVWEDPERGWLCGSAITSVPVPRYAIDYEAAFSEIPRRLRQLGIRRLSLADEGDAWRATCMAGGRGEVDATAPTAPLALCRLAVALLACR